MSEIRIEISGINAKVIVNGSDISSKINGYTLVHKAGDVPELHLMMPAIDTTVEGEAKVFQSVEDQFRRR